MLEQPMMEKLLAMRLQGMAEALKTQEQDPATHQLQGVTCQMRPPEHLIERTAQNQREIGRFLDWCWRSHGLPSLSISLCSTA